MRPSSLYRSDSRRDRPIEGNASNIQQGSIDCGITALKCCNTPGCQKMGNKKSFTIVLTFCALFQGAIESYFRISTKQAALTHDFDPRLVDWLLVSSGLIQGFLAIFIAYFGNRWHRTAWLGGCFMLQAVMCLLVIIPTLVHHNEENNTVDAIENSVLCIRSASQNVFVDNAHGITTLILLFVLQFGIALGVTSLYTLGFSFLDDNVSEHESPGLIAVALAAKFLGVQLGALTSLLVGLTPFGWWFGWVFLGPILFTIGFIGAMFPKRLLATVVKQAANSILESTTHSSYASLARTKFIADIAFIPTIVRLFTNKILLLNISAAIFVQTAIVNFTRHESNYMQSRFFLPTDEGDGLNNEWTSTLITNLLKPPMVSLSILVMGLIIAKVNPSSRKLVLWNIVALSLLVIFFIASIFITCDNSSIAGSSRGKILKPFCAHDCFCSPHTSFLPVCTEGGVQTYFSPCHAGCGSEIIVNNVRMFGNCSCGIDTQLPVSEMIATVGACGMDDCQPFWIVYQALSIFATALLGSTLIGKLIISIRSVLPQDKSVAIALELSLLGIIVYFPGKIGYREIANQTCQYFAPDNFLCYLHENPTYGNLLNIVTSGLILIALLFEVLLLLVIRDLPLYGEEVDDSEVEMEPLRYSQPEPGPEILPERAPVVTTAEPIQANPNTVTYAQILRPSPQYQNFTPINNEELDFRLQTPPQNVRNLAVNDQNSVTSGRSSISSGYIDLHSNLGSGRSQAAPKTLINNQQRPQSPETSF